MKSDTAASDLIATMALIAVFVTAAAIAGVALLSYPPGDAAPAMIARSVTDENGNISLSHDGGDPLVKGHFKILVDGVDRTANFSLIIASGTPSPDWTSWETGQALVLDPSLAETNPHIQIVGEGVSRTGSDWLLHEIGGDAPTETAMPTPTVTSTPGTNVLLNTANEKTAFLRQDGYLMFRVTGANSRVDLGNQRYDVEIDQTVKLVIGGNGYGRIDISGSEITAFEYGDVTLYINNVLIGRGQLTGIYIQTHDSLTSTLTLEVEAKDKWTRFEVDGNTLINGDDNRRIVLYNLKPGTNGVMQLYHPSGKADLEKVDFTGSISNYTLG